MKAKITIEMDNAEFEDGYEVALARILRELAQDVEDGTKRNGGKLYDINGNHVGSFSIQD